jgi:WD40 repeat protein
MPSGHKIATLTGHETFVNSIAFSSDGLLLASASRASKHGDEYNSEYIADCKLWRVSDGRPLATFEERSEYETRDLDTLAFSPIGSLLAIVSTRRNDYSTILLVEMLEERKVASLGTFAPVKSLAFSPDGSLLAFGSGKIIELWKIPSRERVASLKIHNDTVNSVAFSPRGWLLASASRDGTIKLWERRRGFRSLITPYEVESMAFSPDGALLASISKTLDQFGYESSVIILWEVPGGRELIRLKTVTEIRSSYQKMIVSYSPNGSLLASTSPDKTIKLWGLS